MKDIRSEDFGRDFKWGVSTAAYQIEGAHDADGKGASVWDVFVNKRGRISRGEDGRQACDFYNNYPNDTSLIKELHIPNHRFSISWSRILPGGTGQVNSKGVDFYNRLIDHTLSLGIEPWVTLYHWDLPQALQDKGGWTNRDIIFWFQEFVKICVQHFGDRVKNWMVLNEPMVFTGAGYFLGIHAPGKKGLHNFLAAVHHATLCQALGGNVIRGLDGQANIGTTFSCSYIQPYRYREKDILAAAKVDTLLNRLFLEPLLGLGYPSGDLKILQRMDQHMKEGDEQRMQFKMDFIGIQNYTRELVRHSPFTPFLKAKIVPADKRKVERTVMNWEVYPEALYQVLAKFSSYKNVPALIVTENGAAFPDRLEGGAITDNDRVVYLQENIRQVYKARRQGMNVKGYFLWTLLDNFEWAEGYRPKFGIVHVNFTTQERIVKASGAWYSNFLSGNCTL